MDPNRPSRYDGPLLTRDIAAAMDAARLAGRPSWSGSLDLGRSIGEAALAEDGFRWRNRDYPYPERLKDRTIYVWDGDAFVAAQRYDGALIKLVPTEWGAPTFEIDGIKMLPTSQLSPYADAERKVGLVAPRGKQVLDTCGGLGYFARACLAGGAGSIHSFEKNADVLWLRHLNPWSPDPADDEARGRLQLEHADISMRIGTLPDAAYDAILHDPPRFGIAGELYAQAFYQELARVLRPRGRMFHYTGAPNRKTSGRDVPLEVARRLAKAGFTTELALDGVFAVRDTAARAPTRAR
ncbi:MAG: class I SAM-dependent methyltransferase [Dokdonella sp.]|uniref:class I SAM-dependent methyltransferase n=1 Tax=Dokdonella sp. TaxID=2291710 RepID=UPI003F80DDC9